MKIVVFGAESFLGIHLIEKLHKETHKVVGVYQSTTVSFSCHYPHSKYVCERVDEIAKVFEEEKPDVFIFAKINPVITKDDLTSKIDEISTIAYYCDIYKINRVIYLSSTDVYGANQGNEDDAVLPRNLNGKVNMLCEKIMMDFSPNDNLKTVILRLPAVTGHYETINAETIIFKMVEEARKTKTIVSGLNEYHILLSVGDVIDSIYRSVSDNASGIYNITPKNAWSGIDIANEVYEQFSIPIILKGNAENSNNHIPNFIKYASDLNEHDCPSSRKVTIELGFTPTSQIDKCVKNCIMWSKKRITVEESKTKKKEIKYIFKNYLENFVVFAILVVIMLFQSSPTGITSLNLMLLYIIVTSIYGGMNLGVFAAILVSAFNVYSAIISGYSITTALYNMNILISIIQNISVALSIGYVVERKNYIISEKDDQIKKQKGEIKYIKQLNGDLGKIKNESEIKVAKYEEGYGKLYLVFKQLNMLSPNEVFLKSLSVIKDLCDEENVSIYIVQPHSAYMRLHHYIGKKPRFFPNSYKYEDNDIIRNLVTKKSFYTNNYLDVDYPSIIMPIIVKNNVVALIMVEDLVFEKLSLYYINIFKIAANILSDSYSNASVYAELSNIFAYEENSSILKKTEFLKSLSIAKKAASKSNFVYSLIKIRNENKLLDEEIAENILKCIRSTDEIGRLEDGVIGVILNFTTKENTAVVLERMQNFGVMGILGEGA